MGKKGFERSQTREINMSKFFDARATELNHFTKVIQKKPFQTTKTPMQRVPKHMRRRAMAHNRFRIPSRIRALSLKEAGISEQKTLKCRKTLRNSKLLMLHYFKRALKRMEGAGEDDVRVDEGEKWLESHLWHAKRMEMGGFFGYKIAVRNRNKCMRSSYKLAKFKSVLYDTSYNSIIETSYNDFSDLEKLLMAILEVERSKEVMLKGFFEKKFDVFNANFKMFDESIGEVNLVNDPTSRKCLIITHPGVAKLIYENLQKNSKLRNIGVEVTRKDDSLSIFDIVGPHSLLCLKFALENDLVESKLLDDYVSLAYDPLYYPLFSSFNAEVQFDLKKKSLRSPFEPSAYEQEQNLDQFFDIVKQQGFFKCDDSEGIFEKFNDGDFYDYVTRFKVQTRGRYTHKKKSKATNPEKSAMIIENENPSENKNTAVKPNNSQTDRKTDDPNKLVDYLRGREKEKFKIVIQNITNHQKKLRKIRIIAPMGKGRKLWDRIASKVAITVGKKEFDFVHSQFGIKNFPGDYPDSRLFTIEEQKQKERLDSKEKKRPPKKRSNFEVLRSPDPHFYNFKQLSETFGCDELVEVEVEMITKRNPENLSYVCFPNPKDIFSLRIQFEEENGLMRDILNGNERQELSIFEGENSDREIIGRFTKGYFGYDACKGVGRAFIVKEQLEKLESITKNFLKMEDNFFKMPKRFRSVALVKKVTSPYYHFCFLKY